MQRSADRQGKPRQNFFPIDKSAFEQGGGRKVAKVVATGPLVTSGQQEHESKNMYFSMWNCSRA
ncbi:MAG: hypothetical protein GY820_36520 [Gammaproteobacteria bacterium]|nr:hypothetical protein [Gammaproteobacteria bacterium]